MASILLFFCFFDSYSMDIQEEQKEWRDSGLGFFFLRQKGQLIRVTSGREEKEGLKLRERHDKRRKWDRKRAGGGQKWAECRYFSVQVRVWVLVYLSCFVTRSLNLSSFGAESCCFFHLLQSRASVYIILLCLYLLISVFTTVMLFLQVCPLAVHELFL